LPNLFSVSLFTSRARRTLLWRLSLRPREYWPTLPARERLEPPRRIHRHRPPDRFQHPPIADAISVRVALRQLKSLIDRHLLHSSALCFPEHRVPNNAPRPPTVVFFQPRSAKRHGSSDSAHSQTHHQRQRHLLRQRCQRAAQQHNRVSPLRMPCHLVHSLREKPRDRHFGLPRALPRGLSSFSFISNPTGAAASPVHFVRVPHHLDSVWREPRRPSQPQKIIPHRNRAPLPQFRKKPPLERRPQYQRPVQIKKCRNPPNHFARFHAILLAILFPPRATTPSAKYFHP